MDNIQSSRVFGSYLIKQKLGSGGMASVFQAVDSKTGQDVALKILHEHYADDPHIRKRLEHEARIVMRLNHPNIVSVLSYGEAENRPYLVMPYMEGGSLAQLFSKPRIIKAETTIKLLWVLAAGLDYAHSQEVVHRDLKLENILLSKNAVVGISDFGIAQSAHTTRITMTGQILGTPQYLAPENLDSHGILNYRADLYALGIMAYLMLTGYFPFTAKDPLNLAIKHRTEIAPAPSLVNQHLPMTLDPIFSRALAKKPDERFPSAQDFVEALDTAFLQAPSVTTKIFVNDLNPVPSTQPDMSREAILAPDSRITRVLPPEGEAIPVVQPEPIPSKKKAKRGLVLPFLLLFLCISTTFSLFVFNGGLINLTANEPQAESSAEATESLIAEASAESSSELQAQAMRAALTMQAAQSTEELQSSEEAQSSEDAESNSSPTASRTLRPTITPRSSTTATKTPSATPRLSATPTNTPRPTITPRASSTPTTRPTNTTAPTNTPRPLPSNTPQPQPTSVPPTSVPPTNPPAPTAVPPTAVPPTSAPAPTNPPPPTTILDPILDPVNTLVPCIPIPLVQTCP